MTHPVLLAKNLKKAYSAPKPVHVLSDISMELGRGESVAICGRSGEGKTTLLHIFGTLEEADSGYLEIDGMVSKKSNAHLLRRKSIGFIFQAFHLMEDFTALENVLMPAWIDRRASLKTWGMDLLASVDLVHRADFPVKLLSGGEKQRVAIARALCNDPSLILADEPTGNLDACNAKAIGSLLFSLVRERKKSLILATHDLHLASLCNRRFELSSGTLAHIP